MKMKKITKTIALGLITVMPVFSVSAVSANTSPEITLEQVVDANKRENFLKDGKSYQTEISYANKSAEIAYSDSELTSLTFISEEGETTQITVGNVGCGIYEGEYEFYLIADEHFTENNTPVFINCLDKESTVQETIEDCVTEGENLIISTSLSTEASKNVLEGYGNYYVDGDILKMTYTVDAQTYALTEEVSRVEKADGTVEEIGGVKATFNPERPKDADEMYKFMTECENLHTVTIILDPDTENEKAFSADLPVGSPVYPILPDGYETLYLDKECTETLEDYLDKEQDVVVYSIPTLQ